MALSPRAREVAPRLPLSPVVDPARGRAAPDRGGAIPRASTPSAGSAAPSTDDGADL